MRRFLEFCGAVLLAAIIIASAASAQQLRQHPQSGTAADFAAMFPWVVVGLITLLFAILAWFINRYDNQREQKIEKAIQEIGRTNETLVNATNKLDATINTLFERDRAIEHDIAAHDAAIAAIQATCVARGQMCRLLSGDKLVCLDRRDGEERRDDE